MTGFRLFITEFAIALVVLACAWFAWVGTP